MNESEYQIPAEAQKITIEFSEAPDFASFDIAGNEVRLSNFRNQKHVLLVLNRGFF